VLSDNDKRVLHARLEELNSRARVLGREGLVWHEGVADAPGRALVCEIAGRDSYAAFVEFARQGGLAGYERVFLSIAAAPTEYGSLATLVENTGLFVVHPALEERSVAIQFTKDVELWKALAGRPTGFYQSAYGFYTPCVPCHAYFHLLRGFLALDVGASAVLSGERESHGGRIKVNQLPACLDAHASILASRGIELLVPIRKVTENAKIEALVGTGWKEGAEQLECVFSGNYDVPGSKGQLAIDIAKLERMLAETLVPLGTRVLAAYSEGNRAFSAILP
jgi:hypothetical protein